VLLSVGGGWGGVVWSGGGEFKLWGVLFFGVWGGGRRGGTGGGGGRGGPGWGGFVGGGWVSWVALGGVWGYMSVPPLGA